MSHAARANHSAQRRGNDEPAELLQDRHGVLDCGKQASGEQRVCSVVVVSVDFVFACVCVFADEGSLSGRGFEHWVQGVHWREGRDPDRRQICG